MTTFFQFSIIIFGCYDIDIIIQLILVQYFNQFQASY